MCEASNARKILRKGRRGTDESGTRDIDRLELRDMVEVGVKSRFPGGIKAIVKTTRSAFLEFLKIGKNRKT